MTSEGQQDRQAHGRLSMAWAAAMVLGYLAAAVYLVYLSRNQMNPDGVAYIQNARHYAHGRLDLAVNSNWGPLLSWLVVPFVWLHVEETLAFKALNILFGLGLAAGVQSIAVRMGAGRHRSLCFAAALLLAMPMLPEPVTPDLLLAFLLSWYFAMSVDLLWKGGGPRSAAAGAIGGVAYLAKAYAFPFVLAHLCLTFLFRYWLSRRRGARGSVLKPFLLAVAGFTLVACPWVLVISAHDRQITFGSAARLTRAMASPVYTEGRKLQPTSSLRAPRPGRMTSWENPVEIAYSRAQWSPFDGLQGLKLQLITVFRVGSKALGFLKDADSLGMIMAGCVLALCLYVRLGLRSTRTDEVSCLWALGTVGLYLCGYVMVNVEARYLWPTWGLMLVLSVCVIDRLTGSQHNDGTTSPQHPSWWRFLRSQVMQRSLGIVLLLSLGYSVLTTIDEWRGSGGRSAEVNWVRELAHSMGIKDRCVTNSWGQGLYVSYWANSTFLGRFKGSSPEAVAQELAPFGRAYVLVFEDSALTQTLGGSPMFREIGQSTDPETGGSFGAFLFDPSGDATLSASKPIRSDEGR